RHRFLEFFITIMHLTEVHLETLNFDLNLFRCKPLLDFNPTKLGDHMCRRPLVYPRVPLGVAIARSIDGHRLVLESDRSSSQDVVPRKPLTCNIFHSHPKLMFSFCSLSATHLPNAARCSVNASFPVHAK